VELNLGQEQSAHLIRPLREAAAPGALSQSATLSIKEQFMPHAHLNSRANHFAPWLLPFLVAVAGCGSSSENPTGPGADTVAPTVTSTNPPHGAAGVAVITASFSEAMDASTITATTFALRGPGTTPVIGTVTYNATTGMASFVPTSALSTATAYTAMITTGATDVAGNALAINHVWSFTMWASPKSRSPQHLAEPRS
jgi:hypothetical protein